MQDIPGYEGLYAITTDGRVYSYIRDIWLKPQSSDGAGHLHVTLSYKGKVRTWGIHQLVMLTYVGPCPKGLEVCHNDNNTAHNVLSNLRYDTHQVNMLESAQQNAFNVARGEQINTAKLTEEQVRIIRQRHLAGEIAFRMAKEYGITNTAMQNIVNRKTWKHVP